MSGYFFISYSSNNISYLEQLLKVLQQNNIAYWKAPESIPAGSNYAKEIPRAISECDGAILLVSQDAQNSIWVEKELDAVICARKTIIPVQLDREPLNDMYRFYLNNVQMVPMNKDVDGQLKEVVARVMQIKESGTNTLPEEQAADKAGDTTGQKPGKKSYHERANALRTNKIPVKCDICGGELERITMGIYRCNACEKEYYDDYQKVRNYLDKHGAAPAVVISRATKVPLQTIDHFFQEEWLEIPERDVVRMTCQKCNRPIRTGRLCDACKQASEDLPRKKASWHSEIWKK